MDNFYDHFLEKYDGKLPSTEQLLEEQILTHLHRMTQLRDELERVTKQVNNQIKELELKYLNIY